jgi:Ca2+-binding EF-hand superfamily protein
MQLKRFRVSPIQAFEEFDRNKDGKLSREEFVGALNMLNIVDLSAQEVDFLISSVDYD